MGTTHSTTINLTHHWVEEHGGGGMKNNKLHNDQHHKHGNHEHRKQGLQSRDWDIWSCAPVEILEGRYQEVFRFFPRKYDQLHD